MSFEISPEHPVTVVVGTRPEAIKLAPVVLALRRAGVPTSLLSTGQHREMLASVLEVFGLVPDRDLEVMRPDQSLAGLSARILETADQVLAELEPSWVVVQGDTTTVAMMALAAFYRKLRVAHVEAGLRTGDRYDPFPEEMNRTLLAPLAELHFAPTVRARENLLAEGVPAGSVRVVGNTVIDALTHVEARVQDQPFSRYALPDPEGRRVVVVTGHRRESFGAGFEGVFAGLAELARRLAGEILIVYPVHLNPNVREPAHRLLADLPGLVLIEPLMYEPFVKLLTSARLIVTDSGGIQEEATALGVPVLVTRNTSERPEAVEAGVAELVGTSPERLVSAAVRLLTDERAWAERAVPSGAFGDGRAAARIVDALAPVATRAG